MSIDSTIDNFCFREKLSHFEIKNFKKFKFQLEQNYMCQKYYEDIHINDRIFPAIDRPTSICRWNISNSGKRFFYRYNLDDFLYKEKESYVELIDWLRYLIKYFVIPNNAILNGKLNFSANDDTFIGKVFVIQNFIEKAIYKKIY